MTPHGDPGLEKWASWEGVFAEGKSCDRTALPDQASPNCGNLLGIGNQKPLGQTSTSMTPAEQVAQLRELASMSTETRMLDVLIINVLDELAQAVGRLERNQPPGPDKV